MTGVEIVLFLPCFPHVADVVSIKPFSNGKYTYSVECDDESLLSAIKQYLQVHLLGECDDVSAYATLVFKFVFFPPKKLW